MGVHGKSLFITCHGVGNVLTPVPFADHQSSENKRKVRVCEVRERIVENLNRGAIFL